VRAGADPGVALGAPGAFQRRNFALARAAAEAYLGELDEAAVRDAAASVRVPGRLQIVGQAPLVLLDGAHNPEGSAALAESLPEVIGSRRPLVAVIAVLDDKDAAGMLSTLLPHCAAVIFTSSQNPRALPPPTLLSLAGQLDGPPGEIVPDPKAAVARAREVAGRSGAVLVTGSIYLIADVLRPAARERVSTL
jgi:dihydrofolate synthase/folylpolyglutamate synthase